MTAIIPPVNLLDFTHRFLMEHCDGEHATRFVNSLKGTPYDLCTQAGIDSFNALSYSQQVTYIVDYWTAQCLTVGIASSPEARNISISQGCQDFTAYLTLLLPIIEAHSLPIVYTQGV